MKRIRKTEPDQLIHSYKTEEGCNYDGLTKREHFALHLAAALMSTEVTLEFAVISGVEMADELIEQLNRKRD